jgi:hypothetical protein
VRKLACAWSAEASFSTPQPGILKQVHSFF